MSAKFRSDEEIIFQDWLLEGSGYGFPSFSLLSVPLFLCPMSQCQYYRFLYILTKNMEKYKKPFQKIHSFHPWRWRENLRTSSSCPECCHPIGHGSLRVPENRNNITNGDEARKINFNLNLETVEQ